MPDGVGEIDLVRQTGAVGGEERFSLISKHLRA